MNSKNKIVVSLTTWSKRDMYVPLMLEHFTKQRMKPDKIILWLSREEYDEQNLPKYLTDCLKRGLLTDIMWVDKNTYCHKRFECFKIFNDCYNILIDDDILYMDDLIYELYNKAKENPNCVIVYSTNSIDYDGYNVIKKDAINGASHYNALMGGRCCFPPNILPIEAFQNTNLRDKYVTKCDESWIRPLLIKHNIQIYSIKTYNNEQYKSIDDTQDVSVWNENKQHYENGMREKERNFFNAIKIHNAEDVCKKIWPKIAIDAWKLKTKEEMELQLNI